MNISKDAKVSNSEIKSNCNVYKEVDLRNSKLGDYTSIGDQSIIIESIFESNIAINRRNFIQQSRLGRFTYTGFNTVIRSVEIGRFCSISWNVSIGGKDHSLQNVTSGAIWGFHNMNGSKMKTFEYGKNQPPCIIENDVLISSNAVVLRNVTIGNGAVIGAGAVVTKDVEPYAIVAGVPAKKIKMRFEPSIIKALQEIKWWDWPVKIIHKNLDLIYATKVDESIIKKLRKISKEI